MGPLALGIQPLRGAGTGVANYASVLGKTLADAGVKWLSIDPDPARSDPHRALRWIRALNPLSRMGRKDGDHILARDLYREAQVFFDIHRRPMELACEGPAGIVHWTYPVPLRLRGWRNVYTMHDIIPLTHPTLSPIRSRRYARMQRAIIDGADRIVTVSAASKAEIDRMFGLSSDFVVNLGQAVNPAPPGDLPPGLVPGGYLLHCGSLEPRKNIVRLLAAHRASGVAMPLILAGPAGWRSGPILEALAENPLARHLGYLPANDLSALIVNARALLMPSLAEGFGLPVAEAIALGTPVITSDRGALAEISGGAGLPVDPSDEGALAGAIRSIADDNALHAVLVRRTMARREAFTMLPYARRMAAFYETLAPPGF